MRRAIATKPYHVDLADLMRTYETNYAKLNALLPKPASVGEVRCYQAADLIYQLQVLEVTKYTTLVEICQSDDISTFSLPVMSVRLYHDARVAEVCASDQLTRIAARYEYPNHKMVQKMRKHKSTVFR